MWLPPGLLALLYTSLITQTSGTPLPQETPLQPPDTVPLPPKYFQESLFNPHYDPRYLPESGPLSYLDRQKALRSLIQTYHLFTASISVPSWLMHGTLLGWYWNRRILPWDSDADSMTTHSGLSKMAKWYNMTVHHFRFPNHWEDFEWEIARDYLLEVNGNWEDGRVDQGGNGIDARWVDMESGLFIDVTALREGKRGEGEEEVGWCKDGHRYAFDHIFPLRESEFEGVNVSVPFAYAALLEDEYGSEALSDVHFWDHRFDVYKKRWVPYTWRDLEEEREKMDGPLTAYWGERKPPNIVEVQT